MWYNNGNDKLKRSSSMTRFACPRLIRAFILRDAFFFLIFTAATIYFRDQWPLFLFALILCAISGVITYFLWRNAFCRVTIDETGIGNQYLHFTWDEMEANYKIIEIKFHNRRMAYLKDDVICFGEIPQNRSFTRLDPRKAVFIAMDKQTKEAVATFSKNQFRV